MSIVCTDGELYGHHQPFRDLFLERLSTTAAEDHGIRVTTPAAWLNTLDVERLPAGEHRGAHQLVLPSRCRPMVGRMRLRRRRPLEGAAAAGLRPGRERHRRRHPRAPVADRHRCVGRP